MSNLNEKLIIDLIKRYQRILILPSSPLDGDSLGSAVALYLAFKKLNKEAVVVCSDPIPELLQFLPNVQIIGNKLASSKDFVITVDTKKVKIDRVKTFEEDNKLNIILTPLEGEISDDYIQINKGKINFDLIITVDCAELTQLKTIYDKNTEIFHQIPIINIDHHISNNHFGKVNHVDIMSSSTTELLVPLFEQMSEEYQTNLIDDDVATLLLAGIITDTGSFQNANTTPKSFEVAAQLVSYGARQQEIIQHIYKTKQLSQLKLWGRILSKIQTDDPHRMVWSVVSQQDFRDTGSNNEEVGDVIDELMTNAPGAEIIILVKEKSNGTISFSLRTTTPAADASKIAENFGGGGHIQAAGFTLENIKLRDAEYKVIQYIRDYQAHRLALSDQESVVDIEKLINKAKETQKAIASAPILEEENEEVVNNEGRKNEIESEKIEEQNSENLSGKNKRKRKKKKKKSLNEEQKNNNSNIDSQSSQNEPEKMHEVQQEDQNIPESENKENLPNNFSFNSTKAADDESISYKFED